MKIEIISKETIKPSSQTPSHLKTIKFSILDQLAPAIYTSLVLFYPNNENYKTDQKSQKLKTSISEVLTLFYPLAGKINNDICVECDDVIGAKYFEARVNGLLLNDFLSKPETEVLLQFFPIEVESPEAGTGPLLLVQASFFNCGGLAIGICISHKLADASSFSTFINCWAKTAFGKSEKALPVPDFTSASKLFPTFSYDHEQQPTAVELKKEKSATKRFVFDSSKIASLKSKTASSIVDRPTRVEVVAGLIWRCAMNASKSITCSSVVDYIWTEAVNLRKRVVPNLPENCIGNLFGYFAAVESKQSNTELKDLVVQLRQGIQSFVENEAKSYGGDNASQVLLKHFKGGDGLRGREEIQLYMCTSWCNLGFYESADFGWGKPIWLSITPAFYKNLIALIDTRDGCGVEAWVTLSEEEMAFFECDPELLAFASENPKCV